MRRYIIASHHKLAYGLKDTVDFLTNGIKKIYDVNAYVEDVEDVEAKIRPYYKNSPFSGSNYLELKSYPIFFFDQKHTKHIDYTH